MSNIHQLIEEGRLGEVRALLQAEPSNRDSMDGLSNRPLHVAAYSGQAGVAQLLLDSGADANARGDMNRTPLHYAARAGESAIAKLLVEHGAELAPIDAHGLTPLFYAAQGQPDLSDVARVLLDNGVPVDMDSGVWLYDASQLEQRLASEPDAIKKAIQPEDLLNQAVIKGDLSSLEVLLRHGAPINGTEKARPLTLALPRPGILKKLLEANADVNVRDSSGETVLQNARRSGASKEVLELLHKFGAKD